MNLFILSFFKRAKGTLELKNNNAWKKRSDSRVERTNSHPKGRPGLYRKKNLTAYGKCNPTFKTGFFGLHKGILAILSTTPAVSSLPRPYFQKH